jgi:hypothetical protein
MTLLILKLLSERDMYGYEIIEESARRSEDAFDTITTSSCATTVLPVSVRGTGMRQSSFQLPRP